jgi:hypothetical protein
MESGERHPVRLGKHAAPDAGLRTYAIGRPLLLIAWGVALWGTLATVRLLWLAATEGVSKASRFLATPSVSVPILLAVFMWIALGLALRRFRQDGEP